jgi:RNA polymerase sporulation-specific sigma factor
MSGDLALVARARAGDELAMRRLLDSYRKMLRSIAHGYFLMGGDADDLMQEARLGFFKAVRDHRAGHAEFSAFARLCVERQVLTAVKAATRRKHEVLSRSTRFERPIQDSDGEDGTLGDVIPDPRQADPLS